MPGPEVICHHVVSPKDMDSVLEWIDSIDLSRPKKSLARDFSDGVLVAELLSASIPKLVELHNYVPSYAAQQKKVNWEVLNRRVLSRLNLKVGDAAIKYIVEAKPGAIEPVLWAIRKRLLELIPLKDDKSSWNAGQLEFLSIIRPRTSTQTTNYDCRPRMKSSRQPATSLPPRNRPVSVCPPGGVMVKPPPTMGAQAALLGSGPTAAVATHAITTTNATTVEPQTALGTPVSAAAVLESSRKSSSRPTTQPQTPKKTYLGMAPAIPNSGGTGMVSDENNNSILDEIPKILYRGQEMVDYNVAVDLINKNSSLLMSQKELARKVAISEKLIGIKEKRIEELSKQFQMEKRKNKGIDQKESSYSIPSDDMDEFFSPMSSTDSIQSGLSPTPSKTLRPKSSGSGVAPAGAASAKISSPKTSSSVRLQQSPAQEPAVPEPDPESTLSSSVPPPPRRVYMDV